MKLLFQTAVLLILATSLFGQKGGWHKKNERIESMRIAFITDELELTVEEAQVFWPIFNKYENEKHQLRKSKYANIKSNSELTDQDAKSKLDQLVSYEQKEYELKKDYIYQLQNILNAKKVLKLISLDKKFKEDLLKNLKSRHHTPE